MILPTSLTHHSLAVSLDNLPLGVFILRGDYTVLLWNRCLEQWTGLSSQQMVGLDIRERFPHLGRAIFAGRLRQVFQTGAPTIFSSQLHHYVIPVARPDDTFRHQHTVVSSVPDQDGQGFHALFAIQDVTDLTELASLRRQALDQALSEVAARRQTEDELRGAKEESERILRVVPSAIFTVDDQRRILSWNSRAEELTGYGAQEVVGTKCSEFALAPCLFKCGLFSPEVPKPIIGTECSIKTKDGRVRLLRKNVDVVRDHGGEVVGGIESFEDITEQRFAEHELRESEERYRVAIEASGDGVLLLRHDVILFANTRMARMLGLEGPDELTGRTITDFVHPKHRAAVSRYSIGEQAGPSSATHFELIALRQGGEKFPVEISAALTTYQGNPVTLGFVRDTSERKRAEDELRKLSRAVEHSLASVVITDHRGNIEYVNAKFCSLTGYSREEALGQNPRILKSGLMDPVVHAGMWRELAEAGQWQGELLNRKKNGELFWEHAAISAIRKANGQTTHYVAVKEDITERKRAEEALKDSRARLASVVGSSMDAVLTLDSQRRVVECNSAFEKLFGWSRQELLGQSIERLHPNHQTFVRFGERVYPNVRATGSWRGDWTLRRRDGRPVSVEVVVSEQRLPDGELLGTLSVLRDMTERKQAEQALLESNRRLAQTTALASEMADQAQAANQAKSDFLASMSHEIRTPLNGVIGMTGLLLDTELSPEQRQFAEVARSSAEALLTLINDILDLSKIEAGRLDLEWVPFAPHRLVEDVLDIVSAAGHAKGLDLWSLFEEDMPEKVVGDPGRFRQVLFNLLGNAVKFTHRGEVGVRVSLDKRQGDRAWVRFEVRDTGIGIAPEAQENLFAPFTQADASTTRRFGGTGLGLSISKRLVELMGGSIGVQSQPGQGSMFWFALPWEEAEAEPEEAEVELISLVGTRIFCVEKNAGTRASLATTLTGWGMICEEASSGEEALARLRAPHAGDGPFRLVIIDLRLPGMDGVSLASTLRQDPRLINLPLVGLSPLTASGQAQEEVRAIFDMVLPKPLRRDTLRTCLLAILAPASPWPVRPVQGPLGGLAREVSPRARILLAEDNPVNQQLAVHLLAKLGHRVDLAGNGREAVEMASKFTYDLILMDAQMPEMDGFAATREIRSLPGPAGRVPIIAMTAYALAGDRERCLAAGMDDYLSKPINPRDLAATLTRQLERAASAPHGAAEAPPAAASLPVLDMDDLLDRVEGDREILWELAQTFLQGAPGRQVNMEAILARQDWPAIMLEAHSLKGELANLSAKAASQGAREVEMAAKAGDPARLERAWRDLGHELMRFQKALRQAGLADPSNASGDEQP
jgi:PAS domain S-box-containing protein